MNLSVKDSVTSPNSARPSRAAVRAALQVRLDALRAEGYQLIIGYTMYDEAEEEQVVRALLARRPEALVLAETVHARATTQLLLEIAGPLGVQTLEILSGQNVATIAAAINTFKQATGISAALIGAGPTSGPSSAWPCFCVSSSPPAASPSGDTPASSRTPRPSST